MSSNRSKILNMLKEGKISVSEAEELLEVTDKPEADSGETRQYNLPSGEPKKPKYLHIQVEPAEGASHKQERVNIRIPLQLLRAGIKLASVIPNGAKGRVDTALKEKGLDISFDDLAGDKLDELVGALTELSIDVDDKEETVKIFCA